MNHCLQKKGFGVVPLFFLLASLSASAQKKIFKIDFDQSNRQLTEVNDPGYLPWVLPAKTVNTASFVPDSAAGVTITLTRKGPYGDKLSSNWYKAGIQTPYYARLVCDGFRVNNGNSGAQIEMRISGFPAGRHSVMTYHNNVDGGNTSAYAPIDIYVNGVQKYDNLYLSNRETVTSKVPTAYMYVDAVAGQDVVILYVADTTTGATIKNFMINGMETDTYNPLYQAQLPYPQNGDEHVDADKGLLALQWSKAANAVASRLYLGQDSATVANATEASTVYKGRLTDTTYRVHGQYSMLKYYWRVDEEDADGNITPGVVWYYRPRQLAFKDAEGYGRFARGGRGGQVVHVTNLNDSGPGSLRDAVTRQIGARTIVFDVSGLITLQSRLTASDPYITVAGQTAPGKGICIRNSPFGASGDDFVMRHLRLRVGGPITYDGMGLIGNNQIIDNCSISWTMDESFSSRNSKNITLQRTFISEALNVAGHKNYPPGTAHGFAATIGGSTGSFHHNLLAHCSGRNWSMGGGLDGNGYYTGLLDITNNVVYNWGTRTTDGGAHQVNFVNNYYKPGAASSIFYALTAQHEGLGNGTQSYYFDGNVMPGHFTEANETSGRRMVLTNGAIVNWQTFVDTPFFKSYVETQSAGDAYKRVLSNVGNNQPVIDDHDVRVLTETLNGTYTYSGSVSGFPGLPDSQTDVGGWENYPEIHRLTNWDSDNDGLPDWWEHLKRLNIHSAAGDFSDANSDPDKDGFTQLDNYLEWMGGPHYFMQHECELHINLALLARGFTNNPRFSVSCIVNGRVHLESSGKNAGMLEFTPMMPGLASFSFTVNDAEKSTMTTTVNILVAGHTEGLPIGLCNFHAKRKDDHTVSLTWDTDEETRNSSFEVQRSFTAGGEFVPVTIIGGKASGARSIVSLNYDLADSNSNTGISWYRLVQKDEAGNVHLSAMRTVNGNDVLKQVEIWPVPSTGTINILLTNIPGETVLQAWSIGGQRVGSAQTVYPGITKQFKITLPGTYIIKGMNKETGKIIFTKKVIVQ